MQNACVAAPYVAIFIAGLMYAIIRYTVFSDVAITQLPSYISNKAFAFAAALSLLISSFNWAKGDLPSFRKWAAASFAFAAPHVLLSLALWSRDYYPKLYGDTKMNWSGEFTLLFGALNACLFWSFSLLRNEKLFSFRWITAAVLALHTLALGVTGWMAVKGWPGKLPPISLLSCLSASIATLLFLRRPKVDLSD